MNLNGKMGTTDFEEVEKKRLSTQKMSEIS